MNADTANVNTAPNPETDTCPECTKGEHHPQGDVSFIKDNGITQWCICPCAKIMTRNTPLLETGKHVRIIAGKHANKTGYVRTITTNEMTYVIYLPALDRLHYVPAEWVEEMKP